MKRTSAWIAPFPRLRFRLRHGYWCPHDVMTIWFMIDLGRRQMRQCRRCEWSDFR